jgi:FtsH-binding integral membrane protein
MNQTEHAKGPISFVVDGSTAFAHKHMSKRFNKWWLAVPCGILFLIVLLSQSDQTGGAPVTGAFLLLVLLCLAVYFFPAIKAYQEKKPNRQAILVLNIFLGWTLIGWVVALVWAYTNSEHKVMVNANTGISSVLCSSCGKYSQAGSQFCATCGVALP